MINRMKNSIIKFSAKDNKNKASWIIVIGIISWIMIIVLFMLVLLVHLGMLPNIVGDTVCGWFTPLTRSQLGDLCK